MRQLIRAITLLCLLSLSFSCADTPKPQAPKSGKVLRMKSASEMSIEDVTKYHNAAGHARFLRDVTYQLSDACVNTHPPMHAPFNEARGEWEVINGPYVELATELQHRVDEKLSMDNDALTVQQHQRAAQNRQQREVEAKLHALQLQTGQNDYSETFCSRMLENMKNGLFNADPAVYDFLYQH